MSKKGQSALEYLVTYGWAILAIVIIAAVLWYFGIFNPSKWTAEKSCGGFSSVQCLDFKVNATGDLEINLGNKVGSSISITSINSSYAGATNYSTPTTLGPNGQLTATVAGAVASGTSGDSFDQQNVEVYFTNTGSGLTHVDTGFVKGKYE